MSSVSSRSPLSLPVDSFPEHMTFESEHLSSKPEWLFKQLRSSVLTMSVLSSAPTLLWATTAVHRYGIRMFHDLVLDIGQAFATAAPATAAAASHHTDRSDPEQYGGVVEPTSTPPPLGKLGENNNKISHDNTPKKFPENIIDDGIGPPLSEGGDGGGPRHGGSSSSNGVTKKPPPVFHVTEYDVTRGRYPLSWEDHAGRCGCNHLF